MSENLKIWDQLRRVPPDQLKGFKRGGGFSGTAIRPMWTFHKVTEVLGPVGFKWAVREPTFQTVPGVNGEVMVYCTVTVETEEGFFAGVGGDKVVKYIPANTQYNRPERWENDDEAFKKAYTDALTNALKLLGAGADVHMGLWDGNKYVDETPEPVSAKAEKPPQKYDRNPIVRATFDELMRGVRQCANIGTMEDLRAYWLANAAKINALPADWKVELENEKEEAKAALAVREAA